MYSWNCACAYQEILGYFRYSVWGRQQSGRTFRFRRHRLTSPDITDPEPVESALFRCCFFCAWGWTQVSRVIMLPLKMSCVRHGFKGCEVDDEGGEVFGPITSVFERIFFFFFLSWSSVEYQSRISPREARGNSFKKSRRSESSLSFFHRAEHKVPFQHSTL